jgi:hypothetical protein
MLQQEEAFFKNYLFKLLAALSVLLFIVDIVLRIHIISFYTVEIGGIEINVIDGIVKILSGQPLYTDPANPPYDIIQYAPIYYYLVSGIAKMLNIHSEDPQSVFILTRTVALLANLFTSLVVYYTARRFQLKKIKSMLAGIFAFIILTQHYYSRGDSLFCLLFFTSVYFFIKYLENKRSILIVSFALFSFLCIFTKQSGIIIPLTVVIFLISMKNFRAILITAAVYILLSVIFLSIVRHIGGLESFYRNIVLGVKNGMSLDMIRSFYNDKYYGNSIPWVMIGLYLSAGVFRKIKDERYYFIILLLFASFIFAFVTGFKIGSSLNYFIECFILTFLAGSVYINEKQPKIFRPVFYVIFFISISIKTGELFSATYISHFRHSDLENYKNEKKVSDYLINDIKLSDSDYVYLNFRGYTELFLHGNSILNQKDFNYMVYKYAFPEIDFNPLLEKADHGFIKYIISKHTPEDTDLYEFDEVNIFGKTLKNFETIKTFGDLHVYKYKAPDNQR